MEKTLDVVMEKISLEEKTSLSTQVGAPDPVSWASPPTGPDNYNDPTTVMDSTITTEPSQVMVLFACLTDCIRTSEGTDVVYLLTSHHAHSSRKCLQEILSTTVRVLTDHLDRRPVHSHSEIRDSESRGKGIRDCCEGAQKDQT